MKVTKLGALVVGASLVLSACSQGATTAPGGAATKGTVNIAIELPQQGSDLASSEPMINGIKLAVKDAGGVAGSYKVEIPKSAIFDDAKDGAHDPQTGAQNMQAIVALENVMAVIDDRGAALNVEQRVVPGVAYLASE